jgi:hypothetical protein
MERKHGITFAQLVELEPGLESLLWEARQVGTTCRRSADVEWAFSPIAKALSDLVGFTSRHHRHRILGSAGAYTVAYWKMRHAVAGLMALRAGPENPVPEEQAEAAPESAVAMPHGRRPTLAPES